MVRILFLLGLIFCFTFVYTQNKDSINLKNEKLQQLYAATIKYYYTPKYIKFRDSLALLIKPSSSKLVRYTNGILLKTDSSKKVIAFTFDACGGGKGNAYNAALINFLKQEKIPATLFVTGTWIEHNKAVFKKLAADPLFEIENHGLFHRLCSAKGKTRYNVVATQNLNEVIDEMELNARKIAHITGKRPRYFRSATAYIDNSSIEVAKHLKMQVVNYSILTGDADVQTPADSIAAIIMRNVTPGAIVIMHFNHPKAHELQAMKKVIPQLRNMGYNFVTLTNK